MYRNNRMFQFKEKYQNAMKNNKHIHTFATAVSTATVTSTTTTTTTVFLLFNWYTDWLVVLSLVSAHVVPVRCTQERVGQK